MSLLTKMQFKLDNLLNQVSKLIPSASGKMLYNKWVLYFIFVVGIYDVIHFYQRGNMVAVAIFFIVGFLTSFFSKNMIVIIVSAIAVSHIVAYGNKMSEGFEEKDDEGFEEKDDEGFEEKDEEGFDEKDEEGFEEGVEGDSAEEKPEKKKPKNKNTDSEEETTDKETTDKETTDKETTNKETTKEKTTKEEKFTTNGTAQLLADMNKLLQQTDGMVKSSNTKGVNKQGFTTMSYSEYK